MARLKVLLRGALISEIVLQNEKEYIGGRKEGSDIRLQAEKGISREHFKLKFVDGKWNIQAVSRFGDIFSMGQKIEQAALEHGQSFQIPPYEFQLLEVPDSDVRVSPEMAPPINENEKTVIGVSPQVPYIKIVNSKGETREMLRLEVGELWVAGRDPSCQIIIPDQRVSRRQFEIHKVNGTYTVIDLASVNGTFLNGSPVSSTDPQSLKSGDAITVLDNTMYFELHDPNFKYKVEKIEVPPLQLDRPEEIEEVPLEPEQLLQQAQQVSPNYQPLPVEIPQIQQDQVNPQLNTAGGPFTGVPPNFDPNQFYTFIPPQPQAPVKKRPSPLMIAIIVLAIIGGAFYYFDSMQTDGKQVSDVNDPNDPLAKLTPEQRTQVRELYSMAEQMLTQEKYGLAGEKLKQLHEIIKDGYLDSKAMQARVAEAEATKEQQLRDEEIQRIQKENLQKIAEVAVQCEKLLTPEVTVEKMSECLTPIAQIDANSAEYVRLTGEAEKLQRERELKAEQKKSFENQVEELASVFKKAESFQNDGFAFKAIEQYKKVIGSELPDPKKLKEKSKQRIEFIQQKIAEKTSKNIEAAELLARDSKLKDAVAFLREALVYDPNNKKLTQKIETYREELKRQSRLLYQESIIDESYGIVDSTETRQGAKDKWKKIVEIDVDDGEYYRKAVIKLRRYGVL